ncbi:hypothetical protein [Streptomyces parvus]|uniref:hypothetical protein n=1 Tax=Streptomyces parvus TaxID=66428 RepID=UPI0035D604F6
MGRQAVRRLPRDRGMIPAAARWMTESGAQLAHVQQAWTTGRLAEVPIGRLWDVVRITDRLGRMTLARAAALGAPIGPVLEVPARGVVEVVVPPGTAAAWPALPWTTAAASGHLICPVPPMHRAGGRGRAPRHWLVPPVGPHLATDPDALCESVAAELLHRAITAELLRHDTYVHPDTTAKGDAR